MTLAEAHYRFARMIDSGAELTGIAPRPEGPVLAAALAACSGWLEDAATDTELLESLEHGWMLNQAGILSEQQWGNAVAEVFAAVEAEVLGAADHHAN